jgi:hypothetical protein
MKQDEQVMERITISIPVSEKQRLEDEARENKRNGEANGSVSELIRSALAAYKR